MKTTNTRKRPHIEISDDTDSDDDVFGTVPKDVEEQKACNKSTTYSSD